jgi:hypothetical protein
MKNRKFFKHIPRAPAIEAALLPGVNHTLRLITHEWPHWATISPI